MVEYREVIHQGATLQVTEIAPDLVQVLSCHEEPVGVFKKGNTRTPFRN
jgi:hypothetical protein